MTQRSGRWDKFLSVCMSSIILKVFQHSPSSIRKSFVILPLKCELCHFVAPSRTISASPPCTRWAGEEILRTSCCWFYSSFKQKIKILYSLLVQASIITLKFREFRLVAKSKKNKKKSTQRERLFIGCIGILSVTNWAFSLSLPNFLLFWCVYVGKVWFIRP